MARKQLLPYAVILIFLSGCTHTYYSTNTTNIPVFKEKNEVRFSGSCNYAQNLGGDFQAAYAPTNCIGIMANANVNGYSGNGVSSRTSGGTGFLYELGAGYYKPFNVNTKHAQNVLVFEVYGVLGLGRSRGFYWDTTGQLNPTSYDGHEWVPSAREFNYPNNEVTTNYLKAYVQPSISFSHNVVDVIFASKIGFLHSYKINSTIPQTYLNTVPSPYAYYESTYAGTLYGDWLNLNNYRTPFLFEPTITVRIGFKWVKVQGQFTFAPSANPFMHTLSDNVTASMGLSIDIAHRFKKQPVITTHPGNL